MDLIEVYDTDFGGKINFCDFRSKYLCTHPKASMKTIRTEYRKKYGKAKTKPKSKPKKKAKAKNKGKGLFGGCAGCSEAGCMNCDMGGAKKRKRNYNQSYRKVYDKDSNTYIPIINNKQKALEYLATLNPKATKKELEEVDLQNYRAKIGYLLNAQCNNCLPERVRGVPTGQYVCQSCGSQQASGLFGAGPFGAGQHQNIEDYYQQLARR